MRLIGMLDSPYVRRVAVAMRLMQLPFEHESLSVFRQFDQFAVLNPVVKAPTLITDDGVVLMDSTLILDFVERLAQPDLRLTPCDLRQHAHAQRIVGLALAACEKSVQIVYEFNLRPPDKRHDPWIERVRGQLVAAFDLLEAELSPDGAWCFGDRPMLADVTAAVAFRFNQVAHADPIPAERTPRLLVLSERAEALTAFAGARLDGVTTVEN